VSEPASWLSIRPGWKVLAADGSEIGEVNHVTGDDGKDIFNGLAIATSALGKPRYVPAEQIAEIREGEIRLSLPADAAESLSEYVEPATVTVNGGAPATADDVPGRPTAPPPSPNTRPVSIWRRLALLFQRRVG
jgi:hypothetical protein